MRAITAFFRLEAAAGLLLIAAAALAMAVENLGLAYLYDAILSTRVAVLIGDGGIEKPLLLWINDGLMAIFFLIVGLELKREILEGELSNRSQVMLPVLAALGGMAVPALIYAGVNSGDPAALRGWAIPAATDIAFALGILSLLGKRVPLSLKMFLTATAIIDDLGAIIIIALFYTADLSLASLLLAGLAVAVLIVLNRLRITHLAPYILVGIALWVFVLKSGVHATLAGVAVGLAVPLRCRDAQGHSPLRHLEHMLHPWVAYAILPLFAFANAGIPLAGLSFQDLVAPVPLGIALGLVVGKQIGVFGMAAIAIKAGWAKLPEGSNWTSFYGVAALTGVGFTMSLFIGTLAFTSAAEINAARLGILLGSFTSAILGYLLVRQAVRRHHQRLNGT